MRIIKFKVLENYWKEHPDAEAGLRHWYDVTESAEWKNLPEVRETFRHADPVVVASGRTVVVFNIGGNKHRLITAIHYSIRWVYTLMVMPHKDYSRGKWRETL